MNASKCVTCARVCSLCECAQISMHVHVCAPLYRCMYDGVGGVICWCRWCHMCMCGGVGGVICACMLV